MRSFKRFERSPSVDEVSASLWRSQSYHVAKTSRRSYLENLSKAILSRQHQNEVVLESTSKWCTWGLWEWEHQNNTLMTGQNQDKIDSEMTTSEWCIEVKIMQYASEWNYIRVYIKMMKNLTLKIKHLNGVQNG